MRADADDFNPFEEFSAAPPFIPMNEMTYIDPYMVAPEVMAQGVN